MKGGLCFIYTSLLTISVLSSCALFILVVSEALQVDLKSNSTVSADGLQNVTNKINELLPENLSKVQLPPIDNLEGRINAEEPKNSIPQDPKMTFPDALSLNSVTTDGLPDTGQPPIHVSLADTAKLDLKKVDELLFVNDSEQHNDTQTFTIVETNNDALKEKETVETGPEPTLVIKAKPMHEARLAEEATVAPPTVEQADSNQSQTIDPIKQNDSTTEFVATAKPETPHEDIPSFSEWAQKQLAEAEKKDTGLNHSSQPYHSSASIGNKSAKLRSKNYASPACGAKVVAANQEATAAAAVLSHNKDEYMLNTCRSRVWFVVELCEAVQAQRVELANFELFSSTPKDFSVHFSDRYPTREWAGVGRFSAADLRDVQSFDLYPHMFGKFIKVEIYSHHGSEHYCPVSLFRVYGTSEFEALEKENAQHAALDDDDDEDASDAPDAPGERNLFGSARDAVMSIMKKAAQALVHTEPSNTTAPEQPSPAPPLCCSPSHLLVCDNCSHAVYHDVHHLLSCAGDDLAAMLRRDFVRDTLLCTGICQPFGLDFKSTKTVSFRAERATYLKALFTETYLAALCNMLAIHEKKVVLNTSFESEQNVTANNTVDKSLNDSDVNNVEITQLPIKNDTSEAVKEEADPPATENKTPTQYKSNDSDTKTDDNKEIPNESKEKMDPKISPTPVVNDKLAQEQVGTNVINKTDKEYSVEEEKGKNDQDDKEPVKPDIKPAKLEAADKTQKETGTVGEEMNEQILIDSDSFMSEFDQLSIDPTPAGPSTTSNQNQAQTIQKESVFLRLSNRVKALERNMSLSGQYLEELSRRYKKQVEEMQRSFEKTMLQMTEERRKSNEREQKYLEQMTNLQEQLAQMATAIKMLMSDRDSWFGNITLFKFIILQSLIITAIVYYIKKRKQPSPVIVPVGKKSTKRKEKFRRKSVEGVSGHETPSAKKRRPSEEALQIARQSAEELHDDADDDGDWQVARKHRKRKTSIVHRNIESANKMSWTRQDSIGVLQETPISLDEEEFIAPVSEPTEFDTKDIAPKKVPKTNGSIFSNIKNKAKTRRLSSPAFLRTLSRQSSRSTPSPVVRTLEPIFTGKLSRKAASESPTGSLWSESTDMSQVNGQCDSDVASVKQKKKTFKNIFKKVF